MNVVFIYLTITDVLAGERTGGRADRGTYTIHRIFFTPETAKFGQFKVPETSNKALPYFRSNKTSKMGSFRPYFMLTVKVYNDW